MSHKLTDIEHSALRLEISAAHLASICGRGDHAQVDKAKENYLLDAEAFRQELAIVTGIQSIQIQRLLNL